ncbi:hypothetical protein N5923_23210 [Erwiniaceae bacterium BAC15a-03b]|uniref:Uncharacterized protein n=1 Tax=Winslowiella arboricola TaxID=2978220 RepID=A0A9J6PZR2_9GAMM|nr:hypothetical protein [Winslowiella arboricola]MCU5775142.1 hypothetical protein [Winslowiella arboricola]MCU5780404.1 hypothetical protein [Winslowiella arboricola]
MKFNMQLDHNYASFTTPRSGVYVFVDSFDNHEFDVRVGSLLDSNCVGTIHAESDDELNDELEKITADFL